MTNCFMKDVEDPRYYDQFDECVRCGDLYLPENLDVDGVCGECGKEEE
jgi:hypothetical protein